MCEVRDAKYYSLKDLNFTPPNCRQSSSLLVQRGLESLVGFCSAYPCDILYFYFCIFNCIFNYSTLLSRLTAPFILETWSK